MRDHRNNNVFVILKENGELRESSLSSPPLVLTLFEKVLAGNSLGTRQSQCIPGNYDDRRLVRFCSAKKPGDGATCLCVDVRRAHGGGARQSGGGRVVAARQSAKDVFVAQTPARLSCESPSLLYSWFATANHSVFILRCILCSRFSIFRYLVYRFY